MSKIYLDYAAATPVDPRVVEAMLPFFTDDYYNPSAIHSGGRKSKAALNDARSSVAHSIGARPSEIVFTAGGTESINLAVRGVMSEAPDSNCIVSAIEHAAVLDASTNFQVRVSPVDERGIVDLTELEQLIDDHTTLVSIIHASNEIGTVQPIADVAQLIEKIRNDRYERGILHPLYLHIDASQSPNYIDIHVGRLGVDLMTLNGGKIYGPKQSGILYIRAGVQITPQISGGGQEHGLRSGTENVAFAAGFAKALEISLQMRKDEATRVSKLAEYFIKNLEQQFGGNLNGHKKMRLVNNISITFPGVDNERVLFSLDEQGVMAAAGSACSASKEEASTVLQAIGLTEDQARRTLRFSLGRASSQDDIDQTLDRLAIALKA